MLYMKEDDMDEMLRTAAENFDVDAGKAADWDAVYAAVHETEPAMPVEEKRRKRGFAFWWLLLIPLGWIAHSEYNKFNGNTSGAQNSSTADSKTKGINANPTVNNCRSNNNAETNKSTGKNIIIDNNIARLQQKTLGHYKSAREQENSSLKKSNFSLLHQPQTALDQQKVVSQNESADHSTPQLPVDAGTPDSSLTQKENSTTNNIVSSNKTFDAVSSTSTSSKKPSSIKIKSNGHYFYAGLAAGIDLSFVKYQQVEPLGYNVGLLVGYKLNKLSIESGLYLARKNYYTHGEYFDKSKIPFFNSANLLSVDGYCRMYEIPLNIKYDIAVKKRHTWFASAGLSSYLMNKEYYNYSYEQNGQQQNGSFPYYHTTQNWLSVLNVSAGYQLQTGSNTNLRIEPYFKTTLSGVGTGSLSISSAGLNIGLVRRIP